MSSEDPLRFLDLKKKRAQNRQRISSTMQESYKIPSFPSFNSIQQPAQSETSHVQKQYNPLKYFVHQIEQYLNKIAELKRVPSSPLDCRTMRQQKQKQKQCSQNGGIWEDRKIEMITFSCKEGVNGNNKITGDSEGKEKGRGKRGGRDEGEEYEGDNKHNLQDKECEQLNITLLRTLIKSKSLRSPQQMQVQKDEDQQLQQEHQQLKQCEVCSRKFNLASYEKHVKVCEKVFFKKRKPFISRSNSVDATRSSSNRK